MTNDLWLEAKNISCFKNEYEVVKDLNLKLKYSENVIMIGPNGSGKSSLLELINRNIYPVLKKDTVFKLFNKGHISIWELRKKISTVNQDVKARVNANITVFDLIISGLYGKYCKILNKSEKDVLLAENLINKMLITKLSQRYFSHLSEGEKQIVLIARALVKNPEILILDEPIANLDLKSKFYVIDQINELTRLNTKIICVTHDISMITEIYNRVIMMKDRIIIADGTQSETINGKILSILFDINIEVAKYKGYWHVYRKAKELQSIE
ncbi:possible ABC transporter component, ATP-binding domain [Prochlorococcus marinus subsp. pastoris str. CCMP1986]|uniref:Possible ABC transporter component, ATP-binding domain n=1 Tax=Prochlorococcus marinus subsp. pastoris (strain CCMP1986 / NIES-2087 / MED4) TaxID=59919 RepID=Q7V1Q0_PROMP|nr:ABC transporter ATP-binding protein [Prochlorococcus marinus]KGF85800.1 ATPase [Prochlorococcus marinus str. EQPAC1]CAE19266.1 possible ABC transporter component, ATP-binding domain [Prochlorococcus marinus subsp. pastoris str. CCMP1986]